MHGAMNPLLADWTTPFGLPPFADILPEHYRPAFEAALAEDRADVDAIANNDEEATFANTIEALELAEGAQQMVLDLAVAQAREKAAQAEVKSLKLALCALTGEHKSLKGPWGRYDWPTRQGNARWKDIALHLGHGSVPDEVLEDNRANAFRVAKLYPSKDVKSYVAAQLEANKVRDERDTLLTESAR